MTPTANQHPVWARSIAPDKCEVCGGRRAMLAVLPRYPAVESERVYYLCVTCLLAHARLAMNIGYETYLSDGDESETMYFPKRRHKGRMLAGYDQGGRRTGEEEA